MKGYRIAFIRHGMTQANLDGRYIGTTDLPLCREGADQLYEKIEKYDYPSVQKVYTSPLKRCKQTISILQPNRLVAEMPELREMDFGKFENRKREPRMMTDNFPGSNGKKRLVPTKYTVKFIPFQKFNSVSEEYHLAAEEAKGGEN